MFTLDYLAKYVNGKLEGSPNQKIQGVCEISNGIKNKISFISNPKYLKFFNKTQASAVIVGTDFINSKKNINLLKVKEPSLAFIKIAHLFKPKTYNKFGIHTTSIVDKDSTFGSKVSIQANVTVEKKSKIGNNVVIGSNSYIGSNVEIGDYTIIGPNVSILDGCIIGKNVIIQSGTVIGSDGFGYETINDLHHKIPHLGFVIIGNDVEIGANCCIDRGTIKNTIIKDGTKLDNLIQVAHNVEIGSKTLIAGSVAIGGSTIVGNNVRIGGQVGIVDHLKIGDNVMIGAKSCVMKSVPEGSFYSGTPAIDHKKQLKINVSMQKLPELLKKNKLPQNT